MKELSEFCLSLEVVKLGSRLGQQGVFACWNPHGYALLFGKIEG